MLNDLFVLTKIKEGDVKAFEGIFRLYYSPLCLYAAGITGNRDVAEEIVQELFYVFCTQPLPGKRFIGQPGKQAFRSAGPAGIQRIGRSDKQDAPKAARTPLTHLPDAALRRKEICGDSLRPLSVRQNSGS